MNIDQFNFRFQEWSIIQRQRDRDFDKKFYETSKKVRKEFNLRQYTKIPIIPEILTTEEIIREANLPEAKLIPSIKEVLSDVVGKIKKHYQ